MSSLTLSQRHNSELIIQRMRRDVEECGKRKLSALANLLQRRIDDAVARLADADKADEILVAAEHALSEATTAHRRAQAAYEGCSLDRETALRLRDDLEHARQVLAIRQRERDAAASHAIAPLSKVLNYRKDAARDAAARTVEAVVVAMIAGRETIDGIDKEPSPEAALWEEFFAARAIESYEKRVTRQDHFARPVEQLAAFFRARKASVEHRKWKLEKELAALTAAGV